MSRPTVKLKVASANLNQTIVNFTRNVPLIKAAIDEAANDGADVLCLQELGLTGYSGDDYFKWIRTEEQQQEILEIVKEIADYAKVRNPNLVVSLGFPLFYADKSQPVKLNVGTDDKPVYVPNPVYNINNRPFNAQAFISNGQIQGVSLKSIQPDGAAEYEPRQFTSWHDYLDPVELDLPFFGKVKAGNILLDLKDKTTGSVARLYHEICAEGWPGIGDDGVVNPKEATEGRYLSRLVNEQKTDLSLIINPSASKPEPFLDKPSLRGLLATLGSTIAKGAGYVYTNCLGLEAAPVAFEGGSIFVENGEISHRSKRYSMMDVEYASKVMELPAPQKGTAHITIDHDFHAANLDKETKKGSPDTFEAITHPATREAEEIVRNTTLWLRDYLKKTELQGFVISLSGGADSAFGAVMITQMIELNIKQLEEKLGDRSKAVDAFMSQFPKLTYRDEVARVNAAQGPEAAIDCIKKHMLTCIYLPSENSGPVTLNAARTLIEGGIVNGQPVKGIGGTFDVVNVQATVDSYLDAFAGILPQETMNQMVDHEFPDGSIEQMSLIDSVRLEMKEQAEGTRTELSATAKEAFESMSLAELMRKEMKEYIDGTRSEFSDEVVGRVLRSDRLLSWGNPSDDITLQNIQARARLPYPWLFANKENKIACVTSNWSEAVAGYWTFGGDGHMGSINVCGGVPKSDLRRVLRLLEGQGINGLEPVTALNPVNVQTPTAELRKLKPGEIAQTDEADLMPYVQLDAIAKAIFYRKESPLTAYQSLQKEIDIDSGQPLFASKEEIVRCIDKACKLWHRSQFKRVASVITPFLGLNVDPHTAIRTTILSDGFQTALATLKLEYLNEKLGSQFKADTSYDLDEIRRRSRIERPVRDAINYTALDALPSVLSSRAFEQVTPDPIFVGAGR